MVCLGEDCLETTPQEDFNRWFFSLLFFLIVAVPLFRRRRGIIVALSNRIDADLRQEPDERWIEEVDEKDERPRREKKARGGCANVEPKVFDRVPHTRKIGAEQAEELLQVLEQSLEEEACFADVNVLKRSDDGEISARKGHTSQKRRRSSSRKRTKAMVQNQEATIEHSGEADGTRSECTNNGSLQSYAFTSCAWQGIPTEHEQHTTAWPHKPSEVHIDDKERRQPLSDDLVNSQRQLPSQRRSRAKATARDAEGPWTEVKTHSAVSTSRRPQVAGAFTLDKPIPGAPPIATVRSRSDAHALPLSTQFPRQGSALRSVSAGPQAAVSSSNLAPKAAPRSSSTSQRRVQFEPKAVPTYNPEVGSMRAYTGSTVRSYSGSVSRDPRPIYQRPFFLEEVSSEFPGLPGARQKDAIFKDSPNIAIETNVIDQSLLDTSQAIGRESESKQLEKNTLDMDNIYNQSDVIQNDRRAITASALQLKAKDTTKTPSRVTSEKCVDTTRAIGKDIEEVGTTAQKSASRISLMEQVFSALDRDDDGSLCCSELLQFAMLTGFDGDEAAWQGEWTLLCADCGIDSSGGFNRRAFAALIDEKNEAGCPCKDDELLSVFQKMGLRAEETTDTSQKMALRSRKSSSPRRPVKEKNGNTLSSNVDMSQLSQIPQQREVKVQHSVSAADLPDDGFWEESSRCGELVQKVAEQPKQVSPVLHAKEEPPKQDPPVQCVSSAEPNIKETCVASVVKDQPKQVPAVLPAANVEVQTKEAFVAPAPVLEHPTKEVDISGSRDKTKKPNRFSKMAPRNVVIERIFSSLDLDRDGFLCSEELRRFAELSGFEGGDSEWSIEFRSLCEEWQTTGGIDSKTFSEMVNDESDKGCYCSDAELSLIRRKLSTTNTQSTKQAGSQNEDRSVLDQKQSDAPRTPHTAMENTNLHQRVEKKVEPTRAQRATTKVLETENESLHCEHTVPELEQRELLTSACVDKDEGCFSQIISAEDQTLRNSEKQHRNAQNASAQKVQAEKRGRARLPRGREADLNRANVLGKIEDDTIKVSVDGVNAIQSQQNESEKTLLQQHGVSQTSTVRRMAPDRTARERAPARARNGTWVPQLRAPTTISPSNLRPVTMPETRVAIDAGSVGEARKENTGYIPQVQVSTVVTEEATIEHDEKEVDLPTLLKDTAGSSDAKLGKGKEIGKAVRWEDIISDDDHWDLPHGSTKPLGCDSKYPQIPETTGDEDVPNTVEYSVEATSEDLKEPVQCSGPATNEDLSDLVETQEHYLNTCGKCGETWLLVVDLGEDFICMDAGKPCGCAASEAAASSFCFDKSAAEKEGDDEKISLRTQLLRRVLAEGLPAFESAKLFYSHGLDAPKPGELERCKTEMQQRSAERRALARREEQREIDWAKRKKPQRYLDGQLVEVQKGTKYHVEQKESKEDRDKTSVSLHIIGSRSKPSTVQEKKGPRS